MTLPAASSPAAAPTRVMVVDDSVVIRGLVSRWIGEAGGFDIVATASNGQAALESLERVDPEICLLDIEMPVMDGITALPQMLRRRPGMKVVVISTLTQRNAEISLKCLSLGAVDYLPKPDGHRQVTTSTEFRTELLAKMKGLAGARLKPPARPALRVAPAAAPVLTTRPGAVRPKALLIGSSTGGPRAVEEVLVGLGAAVQRVPTLIVQHMPPMFTAVFAERLRTQIGIAAAEGREGEPLLPGRVYIAPGGRHMGLSGARGEITIRLDDTAPVNFCRPAVDVLFRDAARHFAGATVSVILTGMGSDGTEGARALAEAGGVVLAQDEATSTIWGMPGSVVKAGLAQDVLPLSAIGPALKAHIIGPGA